MIDTHLDDRAEHSFCTPVSNEKVGNFVRDAGSTTKLYSTFLMSLVRILFR